MEVAFVCFTNIDFHISINIDDITYVTVIAFLYLIGMFYYKFSKHIKQ